MSSRPSAFVDALPDLTIGLVGIPVAMSLQKIVEDIIPASDELDALAPSSLVAHQLEGLVYFLFILIMYGLVSVGLLMMFEADQVMTDDGDDVEWQRKLLSRLALVLVPVLGLTAGLVFLGQTYIAEIRNGLPVIFDIHITPASLTISVAVLNLIIYIPLMWDYVARWDAHVRQKYEMAFMYYTLVLSSVVAAALGWFFTKS